MGIPINWENDEELMSSSSHCGPAVIHHHHNAPSTSSPRSSSLTTPPVLPPRHPQRRLTQHYQALRQHYADQPAIHRQPSMVPTPPSLPRTQVQHQHQQQLQQQQSERHVPTLSSVVPSTSAFEPDQSQTTRQTQHQRLQRQQQRRSSPSASALFRYYQQQQQQQQQLQQQQEQSQQLVLPVNIHSIAVRPRGGDSAADVPSQSRVSASRATLTTAPASPSSPLSSQPSLCRPPEKVDVKKEETTEAETIEQERIRAYRQAAEYERRKMALEREQLWRRCQQRSTNGAVTGMLTLWRSGQETSNRAPTSDNVSSTTLPKYNDATRATSSVVRVIERAQQQQQRDSGSDSGVDMHSSEEEEEEEGKQQVSQAPTALSLIAGRHHHRSFYALGPHRAPQARSAIPAWPSSPPLSTVSAGTSASAVAVVPTTLSSDHVSAFGTNSSARTASSITTNNNMSNMQGPSVSHQQAIATSTAPIFTSIMPLSGSALLTSMISESQSRIVNNAVVTPSLSVRHPLPPTTAAAATLPRHATPPSSSQTTLPTSVSTTIRAPVPVPPLSYSAVIVQFKETTELQGTMQGDTAFQEQVQQALGPTASIAMCCFLPDDNRDPDLLNKLVQLPIVRHVWKLPLVDRSDNMELHHQ